MKKGEEKKKNHIFLRFLPEVALAGAHTAAISAFYTPLTRRGTDRRCSSPSLKWLPSHAGWLDPPLPLLPPLPIFILRLKRRRQITMAVTRFGARDGGGNDRGGLPGKWLRFEGRAG